MSKKCTPLWREAHFEVKMLKAPGVRTTFGSSNVEKVRPPLDPPLNLVRYGGTVHWYGWYGRLVSVPNVPY